MSDPINCSVSVFLKLIDCRNSSSENLWNQRDCDQVRSDAYIGTGLAHCKVWYTAHICSCKNKDGLCEGKCNKTSAKDTNSSNKIRMVFTLIKDFSLIEKWRLFQNKNIIVYTRSNYLKEYKNV